MKEHFELHFRQYYRQLTYFACQYLQNKELSEDIVQNVFMKLWKNREVIKDEKHLKHYLYKLVKNACINELRSASLRSDILEGLGQNTTEEDDDADFFQAVVRAEVYGEIIQAVESLPTECKKIFQMAYIEQLDNQAIADQLSISINTVKSQKNNAKKRLRELLKDLYPLVFLLILF